MWYYGQKNIILWSEKYGVMGRKIWYYGQKTGRTVPRRLLLPSLSHLSTVFPLLPSQSNRGSRLINFSHFFLFWKLAILLCLFLPPFPSQSTRYQDTGVTLLQVWLFNILWFIVVAGYYSALRHSHILLYNFWICWKEFGRTGGEGALLMRILLFLFVDCIHERI